MVSEPRKMGSSPVVGRDCFYVMQSYRNYDFNMGITNNVLRRRSEHESSAGPQTLIGVVPNIDRAFERDTFADLHEWRVADPGRSRRDYEIFAATPEVIAYVCGEAFRALGFKIERNPKNPLKQTDRDWLRIVAASCRGKARTAAEFALSEDARLRKVVPKTARGGWVLGEALGGRSFVDTQLPFGFAQTVIHGKSWTLHRVTYRGASFDYPVFAEWCERFGRKPDRGAVRTGVKICRPIIFRNRTRLIKTQPRHEVVGAQWDLFR